MLLRIKTSFFLLAALLLIVSAGCKKGTFDINSPNPNQPSSVSPQFILSAALGITANSSFNAGYPDFANRYMGYWAFSGDFGGYGTEATYNITSAYASNNWDVVYSSALVNYRFIATNSTKDPKQVNYLAIAKIMQSFHFQRLVDSYNNVPYSDALNGGVQNYPKFDDAKAVYTSIIKQLDSAIQLIKAAPGNADNPAKYDAMFGGTMTKWVKFANTLKLKILLNLTQTADGPALAKAELAGLSDGDFLVAGEDAAINPGYSNSSTAQQNPLWQNIGYATNGSPTSGNAFNRANSYAVNFYLNTNDPRAKRFYDTTAAGLIKGRVYGSTDGSEHNTNVSGMGKGVLQAASQSAIILPAFESLFFQAEAQVRGYLTGTNSAPDVLYKAAVKESFRLLWANVASFDYGAAAAAYVSQADARVSWTAAPDKIALIITQEWAALNMYDPYTSWNNWRRLGIPNDLPISVYPGTTANHIPIRLLYTTNEYSYNAANTNAQGTISPITSKIFWMP